MAVAKYDRKDGKLKDYLDVVKTNARFNISITTRLDEIENNNLFNDFSKQTIMSIHNRILIDFHEAEKNILLATFEININKLKDFYFKAINLLISIMVNIDLLVELNPEAFSHLTQFAYNIYDAIEKLKYKKGNI